MVRSAGTSNRPKEEEMLADSTGQEIKVGSHVMCPKWFFFRRCDVIVTAILGNSWVQVKIEDGTSSALVRADHVRVVNPAG